MDTHDFAKQIKKTKTTQWLIVGGVILLVVASFYGGTAYQKSKTTTQNVSTSTNPFQRFSSSGYPGDGSGSGTGAPSFRGDQVTAVSSTSITLQDSQGTAQTYSITSDTRVVKDRQEAAASDIAVGDSASVIPSSSDSSTAWIITITTGYGGGYGGGAPVVQQDIQAN